jgi:hypothetical protein
MPVLSLDALRFSDLAWKFKLLLHEQKETSVWHAWPFASAFKRAVYHLVG